MRVKNPNLPVLPDDLDVFENTIYDGHGKATKTKVNGKDCFPAYGNALGARLIEDSDFFFAIGYGWKEESKLHACKAYISTPSGAENKADFYFGVVMSILDLMKNDENKIILSDVVSKIVQETKKRTP